MLKKTRTGFAVLEAVLILVVVAIIGGTGYFVWNSQKTTNKTLSDANKITNGKVKPVIKSFEECKKAAGSRLLETYPEQCVTKDGKRFTQPVAGSDYAGVRTQSAKGGFSIVIPNGWLVRTYADGDKFYQYDVAKLKYDQSTPPIVKSDIEGGVGGYVPGISIMESEFAQKPDGTTAKFTLDDGVSGLCARTVTSEIDIAASEGAGSSTQGDYISKVCYFEKNGKKLNASYGYWANDPLDTKLVEWAFKTLIIK